MIPLSDIKVNPENERRPVLPTLQDLRAELERVYGNVKVEQQPAGHWLVMLGQGATGQPLASVNGPTEEAALSNAITLLL